MGPRTTLVGHLSTQGPSGTNMPAQKEEKVRIDQLLFQRGLAPSRERAQALILAGKVLVNEQRIEKPGQRFAPQKAKIRIKGKDHPFVSRGGVKLAGALDQFDLNPSGKTCLDVGASTGGFTDCLLQRGARKVYTIDCGTNQLDYRLRQDPRVHWQEKFNVRELKQQDLPEPVDLVVVDLSFISLKLVLPVLVQEVPGFREALLLVKPQFEAGRHQIDKGGIVKEAGVHQQVIQNISEFAESLGLQVKGVSPSELKGEKGNQEYFIWALRRAGGK